MLLYLSENRSRHILFQPSKTLNRYGHQIVKLGTYRRALVHVLVAEAFIGPKRESQEVRYLNGDPIDNRASNLVYGTRRENQRDQYTYGGKHAGGKLSRDDVLAIRALLSEGVAQKEIAAAYGVSLSQISAIKTRRSFDYI